MSHEMRYTQDSIAQAEARYGHKITFPDEELPKERKLNYFVPNFGVDEDIKNTHSNIAGAESRLGHQLYANFSLTDGVPRNYFVPDFGVDTDIAASLEHSKTWTPSKDEDGKFVLPASAIEFKL